jgi:hypothetical protein
MSAIRVCKRRGCKTHLSRFNPGTTCYEHTAPSFDADHRVVARGVMSEEFLRGVPGAYAITNDERRHWARGG